MRVAGNYVVFDREQGVCYQPKAKGQCSKRDQCNFQHDTHERAKSHQKPLHLLNHQHQEVEVRREKGASEASKKTNRRKKTSQNVLALNYIVTVGICRMSMLSTRIWLQSRQRVLVTALEGGTEQKKTKKEWCQKCSAFSESAMQDAERPESAAISRKGTKILGPIRRVRFTKATQRHANIRESKRSMLKKKTKQTSSLTQSLRHEI